MLAHQKKVTIDKMELENRSIDNSYSSRTEKHPFFGIARCSARLGSRCRLPKETIDASLLGDCNCIAAANHLTGLDLGSLSTECNHNSSLNSDGC